jgi:hypothetical protein
LEDQASEMVKQFKEKFEFTVSCNVTFLFGSSSFVEASFLPPRHLFYCAVNPRFAKSG